MNLTIRELPRSERPRERLAHRGAEALSHQELLACVLGRGVAGASVLHTAHRLLEQFGSLRALSAATIDELARVHGIGVAKAAGLAATFELGRRALQTDPDDRVAVTTTEAAVAVATPLLRDQPTERMIALLLDTKYRLTRVVLIAMGSLDAAVVHPRDLFHEAVRARAAAVIVAHNHPSGDPTPSPDDIALTEQLQAAGRVIGIPLLDHLIIGRAGYTSVLTHHQRALEHREE